VTRYEIRYAEGTGALDGLSFSDGIPGPTLAPGAPGTATDLVLTSLQGMTTYTVGVRVSDECLNRSTLVFFEVVTDPLVFRTVPPCGCRVGEAGGGALLGDGVLAALVLGAATGARRRGRRPR
jgi:MYXO-CTERM domain-containing protein